MLRFTIQFILAAVIAAPVFADYTVEIQGSSVSEDAYVSSNNTTTNYDTTSMRLRSYTTYETCWGLIKFEMPVLEPNEFIIDANITFDYFANDNSTSGTATVTLHQILYPWNETEVTWNERLAGIPWQGGNIGWDGGGIPANYAATSLGSVDLPQGVYSLVTYQSPELTYVLNQMALGVVENNGFLLNTGRTYGTVNNSWYFASSERTDQVKPKLVLTISTYTEQVVEIQGDGVTEDAYVDSFNNTDNFNTGSYRLKNYSTSQTCWGLVKFGLPALSAGQYISDANITFDYFANDNSNPGTLTVNLQRLLYPWDETEVTWDERLAGTSWEPTPAGNIGWQDTGYPALNYSPTVLDSMDLVVGDYNLVTFQSSALTTAIDQMAKGNLPYYGFLLNTGRNYGPLNNSCYFASSDRADQVKPKLTLTISYPEPEIAEQYPFGWYDAITEPNSPQKIADSGGNIVLAYSGSANDTMDYLDEANDLGLRIILQIPHYYLLNQDVIWIRRYVTTFDSHPALYGWYLADEPVANGISVTDCEIGYDAIKLESTKPVFMVFTHIDLSGPATSDYANAYDVLMVDYYPFDDGDAEFQPLNDYKTIMQSLKSQAVALNKPWWPVIQGFGDQTGLEGYRLPTYDENKFSIYWTVLDGAEGILSWAHYRALSTPACAGCPYTGNGQQWLDEIWAPVAEEFALHGKAIDAGAILAAVTDDETDIIAKLYQHPDSGIYYLIALNDSAGSLQPTFTLSGLPDLLYAAYIGQTGTNMKIVNDMFTDTFSSYQTHVYKIITIPDADNDGDVDLHDYAIMALHFTSLTDSGVSEGDFDGDGDVDLNDLDILAENFGWSI